MMADKNVRVFALGGLGEIGKNMYCVAYEDEIVVIDSGLKFPDEDMLGIDIVIPDVSFLRENKEKVKGIFLTHGHEDHIGGLPYVLREVPVPVYGASLTIGLVESKLQEHGLLRDSDLNVINGDSVIRFKSLSVSFFRTNHSIPDSYGVVVHTPKGNIVHTGDFKFDLTPVGNPADLSKMAEIGSGKVLALLSDSTNSERLGTTPSERVVGENIDELIGAADGRILFATFASNVYRLQQVVDAVFKYNKKLAVVGRSMEKVFQIGQELGYINVPKDLLIDIRKVNDYPLSRVVILCTGSQGEPMAVLSRIAQGSHRHLQLVPGDTVIFSSSPIPGNTKNVYRTIDQLYRAGANVVYGSFLEIHASGHGSEEELKLMLNLIKPRYFIPIHGEYRMLKTHAALAERVGINRENIFILDNGDVVEFSDTGARRAAKVPSGVVMIDGSGIGDVGNIVLRDRKRLSEGGLIVVVMTIDMKNYRLLTGPDIISRGFVYVRESEDLIRQGTKIVQQVVNRLLADKVNAWSELKNEITKELTTFFYQETERNPMILPIIMEIKNGK
jgi:ribonuclease J